MTTPTSSTLPESTSSQQTTSPQQTQSTTATPTVEQTQQSIETAETKTTENVNSNAETEFKRVWLQLEDFATQSYIVLDLTSGKQVMGDNAELPLEAGSLTHLMTLYTVLNDVSYDPYRVVTLGDILSPETIFLSGEAITTETALFAMYYGSSEESALALADTYGPGGEGFLEKMNRNAQSLGMVNTNYLDPTGTVLGSTTTVKDTTKLLQALEQQAAFRTISESSCYLPPSDLNDSVTGMTQLHNPASIIDVMSSDYLTQLNGLILADNPERGAYGAGFARTNDGQQLLAVVMGATSNNDAIRGEQRAAHAIRTLLEEGAKSLGVPAVDNRSILAIGQAAAQPQTPESTEPIATEEETTTPVSTTTIEPAATVPLALNEHQSDEDKLGWLFYVVLAVLILAIVGLIIGTILTRRKKREQQQRRRDQMTYAGRSRNHY